MSEHARIGTEDAQTGIMVCASFIFSKVLEAVRASFFSAKTEMS